MSKLVDDVLLGNRAAIGKMMSIAEMDQAHLRAPLNDLFAHTGKAHIIGVTGVPGSGKSTLVQALAKAVRTKNAKVGIVAIDPSSPYSGGAIMGDRVRMGQLARDEGTFIRSLATRGALGGLSRACMGCVDVLDAAGFDYVFIETVGVGQDEIDIATAAHTVLVVSAPGLGDGVQAIKAGVLEIADIHVVSKSDKPDAETTQSDLESMMALGAEGRDRRGWEVPVVLTSAETGDGLKTLTDLIGAHKAHLHQSGEMRARLEDIAEMRVLSEVQDQLRELLEKDGRKNLTKYSQKISDREINPGLAAKEIVRGLLSSSQT